jgi:23S rRNA (adenine2503-C2)-methyltransferase
VLVEIIKSHIDQSVNFIDKKEIGYLESRFVRRVDDYFITYLSSQTGCDQACRMCHLTSTGQNKFQDTKIKEFIAQAQPVLSHYDELVKSGNPQAKSMHYNFMARGEPLNNPVFRDKEKAYNLLKELRHLSEIRNLSPRFLISSIIPKTFEDVEFEDIFGAIHPNIYYSLYSMNEKFRKKWLNKALDPNKALQKLARWEQITQSPSKIHFALIEGENDSEKDMLDICKAVKSHGMNPNFNIVRYNPASAKYGAEPSEEVVKRNAGIIESELGNKVKVIPRVGTDVYASCGMFIK